MPVTSVKKMVTQLDANIPVNDTNQLSDALGEFANMICGNATAKLSKINYNASISTPTIITGAAFEIHLLKQTTFSTELKTPFGNLEMNVAVKKI